MVNDCVKRSLSNFFLAGKQKFSLNKAKKEKEKTFFVESLDQFRRLEV